MKRYFVTKSLETALPYVFVHAIGKRYISLVSCDFVEIIDDGDEVVVRTPAHISVHSSIVQEDPYCDSFVDFVNRVRDKRPKYQQTFKDDTVRFWFKNIHGIPVKATGCEFTIKLLLEWPDQK